MKHHCRPVPLILTAAFLFSGIFSFAAKAAPAPSDAGKEIDLLFLHDTHSHLESFLTIEDGQAAAVGGFPQIKTLINEAKAEKPETLVVDAGDFSMGTLVQTIFTGEAAELRMLGELGCEVTTLGNHEFDYRSRGLAASLQAAAESGDPVPALVLCNIDWDTMEAEGLTEEQRLLKDAFEKYGMRDYTVITKGDVRIAVLGIFGEDSLTCAPTCVLKFKNASKAAAETVANIRANENVDLILCVSHSGTNSDQRKSEDEILAKSVPEIDLIVSGHTHTALEEPICHGDTYIVSCGEYGKNLGALSMRRRADGRWEMASYELMPITPAVTPDAPTQAVIDGFMESVDSEYLSCSAIPGIRFWPKMILPLPPRTTCTTSISTIIWAICCPMPSVYGCKGRYRRQPSCGRVHCPFRQCPGYLC